MPTKRRAILLVVTGCFLAVLAVFGIRLARGNQQAREVTLQPYTAPPFGVDLFHGGHFSLDDERGKAVVVNFWASWCVPCQDEAPVLEAAYKRYQASGIDFVGVDIKDTPEDAQSFLGRYVSTYPNGFDAKKQIYIDYGVYGLPETFVVDRDGKVIHHVIGPVNQQQLDAWLQPLVTTATR